MNSGMNPAWERALADCRANLASDPERAAVRAAKLREDARTNGERLRAHLTLGYTEIYRGRLERCREEYGACERYPRPGPLARSDLAVHWGYLHLFTEDLDSAADYAGRAVELAEPLALASRRPRRKYNPHSVVPRAAYAAALLTRAEVRLRQGSAQQALSDTNSALSWVDPRFTSFLHVAGLTILGRILVMPGVATPDLSRRTLILCRDAHRILMARKVRSKDPYRVKVRALEGLAHGVLGSLERSEAILLKAIHQLQKAGLEKDASIVAEHLVWLIGHRAGKIGRARVLAARYGVTVDVVPKPLKPLKPLPVDDEPIGF